MLYYSKGSENTDLSAEDLKTGLFEALSKLGNKTKVLAIPPDYTRFHSRAGELTEFAWQFYREKMKDVLPALGTHTPMKPADIEHMFGKTPKELFREHNICMKFLKGE